MINIVLRAYKMLIGHLWQGYKCHFVWYIRRKRRNMGMKIYFAEIICFALIT